ncbi:G-type lectin S-receptor-like serine/threonine-protein kinase LECRK3 [Macadamia integrifolia]|uniref:G-type lectin S-receptor-like serine/threonine-protein kinase LECRK3 n=1 Tax=Macadamia integrifolia TaxID=60698 RepID=UPI001C4E6CA6|nr:G-type lectin S-receptor-like serine/threonine-protein kinase LECRK3 [Macadamia integrifolia]
MDAISLIDDPDCGSHSDGLNIKLIFMVKSSNISLGSSLSPSSSTNSSWLSPSGTFAFGFYPKGDGFAIGIWFAQIPQQTVVWTLYRDDPPLSINSTLLLTKDGSLILQKTQGGQNKSIVSSSASRASMFDSGNFVLYNSSGMILWKSFDFPTDTLLPGQPLLAGNELFSSLSDTDHSTGMFTLNMQGDGNLVQYPNENPLTFPKAYWASDTNGQGDKVELNLDADGGYLYLLNTTNLVTVSNISSSVTPINSTKLLYRMTIDVDGIFRVYSISVDDQKGNWSTEWESSADKCDPKGICSINAYCTYTPTIDTQAVCKCVPGFDFIDGSRPSLGCERKSDAENCGPETMSPLEDTTWETNPYYMITASTTEGDCNEACLADKYCEAVSFNLDQQCRKLSFPIRYGRAKVDTTPANAKTSTFYVKVSGSCSPTTPSDQAGMGESKGGLSTKGILIICLSFTSCAFMVLACCSFLVCQNRVLKYRKISDKANNIGLVEEIGLRSFTYCELEKVTEDFKEVVGRGAFSTVFKGNLSNGMRIVAVKKLDKVLAESEREFQTEMRVIAKTHHRNLVQLLGYCCDGPNRLLVYEYMSNGSLADFLFKSEIPPSWQERMGIALNIAKGILYLHEECDTQIIHCDIKPQNILMDEDRCPKIADFGLSKLLQADQTRTQTMIRGTRGYVAPEWHRNLPVTVKADVYSYGVMFLEIICLRRGIDKNVPEEEIILVDWADYCFEAGELGKLVGDEEVEYRMLDRMVRVAILCIQEDPSLRPSMKKVVLMLEGTIEVPIPPCSTSFLSAM